MLNRTLVGRDRFTEDEPRDPGPSDGDTARFDDSDRYGEADRYTDTDQAEATDVLDAIADESGDDDYERFTAPSRDDQGKGRGAASA